MMIMIKKVASSKGDQPAFDRCLGCAPGQKEAMCKLTKSLVFVGQSHPKLDDSHGILSKTHGFKKQGP